MIIKGDKVRLNKYAVAGKDAGKILTAASDEKVNQAHGLKEVYVEGFKQPFLASYLVKVN